MNIKTYLKSNRISVAELSRTTKLPYTSVSELINGKVDIDRVYVGTAMKLAEALDISFDEFYTLCRANIVNLHNPDATLKIKNKKYYVAYDIDGNRGEAYLFKVNDTNKKYANDAAQWEIDDIRRNIEEQHSIKEVEEWSATDTI